MTPGEITGPLNVVFTEFPRMHVIENDVNAVPGEFKDKYVRFDGYFGPHGPHVFAVAPQLLEALEGLLRFPLGTLQVEAAKKVIEMARAGDV
jgi:hypothetical protein